jgi:hypothetical protein
MGYTTEFQGSIQIQPPLNDAEIEYLRKFNDTRRMDRAKGPYFVDGTGEFGQGHDADIRDFNRPPAGQPGLWCHWTPTNGGTAIEWDGGEKFYHADAWMAYLIDHFLKPGAEASKSNDPQFNQFTFDHVCNGVIKAQGEDMDDRWKMLVEDNKMSTKPLE